jgi:uncharacterized protein (DUF952 family)
MEQSPIFHITEPSLWARALQAGEYTGSTRDAGLGEVGFIHCSFRHQVEAVADCLYGDWEGTLLLLEADPRAIPSEVRVENLDGGREEFPHIYGPLPVDAVRAVHQLVRQGQRWRLLVDPDPLRTPDDANETGLLVGTTGDAWEGIAIKNLKDRHIATGAEEDDEKTPHVGPAGHAGGTAAGAPPQA